jgi:hypothetical protein
MHLAQMTAEVELGSFCSATCTIDTLWCNLIGVIHLAPFLCYLEAHFVVVLHRGDASLTGLAVDATACNHFIHITELFKIKEIKVCPAGILSIEMLLSTLLEAEALIDSVHRCIRDERIETDGLHALFAGQSDTAKLHIVADLAKHLGYSAHFCDEWKGMRAP